MDVLFPHLHVTDEKDFSLSFEQWLGKILMLLFGFYRLRIISIHKLWHI